MKMRIVVELQEGKAPLQQLFTQWVDIEKTASPEKLEEIFQQALTDLRPPKRKK